jgi:protein-disulfide isomerase
VEATPTFVFGTVKQAGNLGFDRFAQLLAEASRA